MAPKYTLYYFNVTALGEPIRYILSYANQDFEDVRYGLEEWPKHKSEMPLGKMPVLEIDGKKYHQSVALSRYLGKLNGLGGKDELEDLQIDIAVDNFGDFRTLIGGWFYDSVEVSKAAKYDPLIKEHLPFYLGKFEETVKNNGGYLVNGKLTWADLYFIAPLKYYNALLEFDMLEKYPALKELQKKVESNPKIAAYLENRPQSDK